MDLIEAVKSGWPFRPIAPSRPNHHLWYARLDGNELIYLPENGSKRHINYDDLMANWEIQEPSVTITLSQFWDAIESVPHKLARQDVHKLARALGLGEP